MTLSFRLLGCGAAVAALLAAGPAAAENPWWKLWSGQDAVGAAPAAPQGLNETYPVAQAPGPPDFANRMDRIEAQMRTITGQIEELSYQLRQLQDQLKRMQDDTEFRFGELESGTPQARRQLAVTPPPVRRPVAPQPPQPAAIVAGAPPAPEPVIADNPPPADEDTGSARLAAPPRPLGALVLDAPADVGGRPLDLSTLARGTNPALASQPAEPAQPAPVPAAPADAQAPAAAPGPVASLGDARSDYDRAYNYVLSGDYDLAEFSFRQFLTAYPRDALAPDAQYWLGESLFARARYREAADQFLAGYKAYPKSAKGPDTLLKLGLSLAGLGERDAACKTYAQVLNKYPQASNALRQRVVTEQASANC